MTKHGINTESILLTQGALGRRKVRASTHTLNGNQYYKTVTYNCGRMKQNHKKDTLLVMLWGPFPLCLFCCNVPNQTYDL